jgi:hypothetical protein
MSEQISCYPSTKITNAKLGAFDAAAKAAMRNFKTTELPKKRSRLDYVLGPKKENRSNIGSRQRFAKRLHPLSGVPHTARERKPESIGSPKRLARVRQDARRYLKRKGVAA